MYSILYKYQKRLFIVIYFILSISIFVNLLLYISKIPDFEFQYLILIFILYTIICIILGCYLYVLFDIPLRLSYEFDSIKNDIAKKKIIKPEDLAKRIADFITSFFNYAFFDLNYSVVYINDYHVVFSDPVLRGKFDDLDNYVKSTKNQSKEELIYIGKRIIKQFDYHTYLIPIWFEDMYLGFICTISKRRISPLYRKILIDFKNNYVDDQILYVLNSFKKQT